MFLSLFPKRIPFVLFLFHSKMTARRKCKMAVIFCVKEIFKYSTQIIMMYLGILSLSTNPMNTPQKQYF
jgi:hypothetical protein